MPSIVRRLNECSAGEDRLVRDVKEILERQRSGDSKANEELTLIVYSELRKVAGQLMIGERGNHTLTPTALVHEAYMRLVGGEPAPSSFQTQSQFFAVAAQSMRHVLIDSARRRKAQKRGGGAVVLSLEAGLVPGDDSDPDIEELDEALKLLEQTYPDLGELVTLRFFGGMTMPQAADAQGISLRTAERNWHFARAWLKTHLEQ